MPIHDFEVVGVGEHGSLPPSEFEEVARQAVSDRAPFHVSARALLDELSRRRNDDSPTLEFDFDIRMLHDDPFSVNATEVETGQWTSIAKVEDTVHFSFIEP